MMPPVAQTSVLLETKIKASFAVRMLNHSERQIHRSFVNACLMLDRRKAWLKYSRGLLCQA